MDIRTFLGFRRLLQPDRLLQCAVIQLGDFLDVFEGLFGLVRDLFFSELFVIELHNLLDGPNALAQIIANRDEFLDDDWRPRDRLHDHKLPALDALGDGHFAFTRQQRDRAHFAQVHAHRVVGFFQRAGRSIQIALALVRLFLDHNFAVAAFAGHFDCARGLGRRRILINLDAVALKCREKVVDLFRGMHFGWKRIVYFVIQQVAALFADRNALAYRIIFLFKTYYRHKSLPNFTVSPPRSALFGANLLDSLRHKQTRSLARTVGYFPQKIALFIDRPAVTKNAFGALCTRSCRSPVRRPRLALGGCPCR